MTKTTQPLGHALRNACKAFNEAMDEYDISVADGVNYHGSLGSVIGAADNLKAEMDQFFTKVGFSAESSYTPDANGIVAAARDSAYIRKDETSDWLRIDSVDDVGVNQIITHDENKEFETEQVLEVAELDPTQVEFMKLVPFKLTTD